MVFARAAMLLSIRKVRGSREKTTNGPLQISAAQILPGTCNLWSENLREVGCGFFMRSGIRKISLTAVA